MSRIRLLLLPHAAGQPAPFMIVGSDGGVLQRGLLREGDEHAPEPMRTVVVVPGADVLIRWLDLPARSEAQAMASAAWRLRDEAASDPERLRIGLGRPAPDGRRMVVAAGAAHVEAWVEQALALGVRPDVLLPDSLTLPRPVSGADPETAVAAAFGATLAVRGVELAATAEPELARLAVGHRRLEEIADPERLDQALIAAALDPEVNLLGRSRPEARAGAWRLTAALAAAVLVSPLIVVAAHAAHDDWTAATLNRETEGAAREVAPDLAPGADPVAELRRMEGAGRPSGGAGGAAAALFAAVEEVQGAELDSFSIGDDGVVRATATYPAFSDLDALKAAAARRGLSLSDQSTVEDQGKVVSELVLGASR